MKKLGKILLFILNVIIDVILVIVLLFLLVWMIWGITPNQSVQRSFTWIEQKWDNLTGQGSKERTEQLSKKYRRRAHRHLYVQEPNKKTEGDRLTQPYKYE